MDSDTEFFEDFGAGLKRADVERLLERARATSDGEIRLLAKQYLMLQRVTAALLEHLEAITPPERLAQDQWVRLARFCIKD